MSRAPTYPLFLDLVQLPVLVVGGGSVGLRKARGLVECAARVTVVSPAFAAGFDNLPDVEKIPASYAQTHMARKMWRLVFAATDAPAVNAQVQKHAEAAGIFVCRADEPDEGDFSSGATARVGATRWADGRGVRGVGKGGGIVVAVSTAGASPVLAARICREAAAGVDPVLPMLADLLEGWRAELKRTIPNLRIRRALLQRLAGEEMETLLRKHGAEAAQAEFQKWFDAAQIQAAATDRSQGADQRGAEAGGSGAEAANGPLPATHPGAR
jgi:precorrin-2 dehydrogenase / sirohydrochlorin ferrochelatase